MATQQPGTLFNALTTGSKIIGTIIADSDIRIDGTVEGDIQCKGKIVIGEKGSVKGNINCQNAEILGHLDGKAAISDTFSLRSTGTLTGELNTKILIIEPNAQFNGTCSMKQQPVPAQPIKK